MVIILPVLYTQAMYFDVCSPGIELEKKNSGYSYPNRALSFMSCTVFIWTSPMLQPFHASEISNYCRSTFIFFLAVVLCNPFSTCMLALSVL